MRTVHCPLCGLGFLHGYELDLHAREDHAPPPAPPHRDTLTLPSPRAATVHRSGAATWWRARRPD